MGDTKGRCSTCGVEAPLYELLRVNGTTVCSNCFGKGTKPSSLHPALWLPAGIATGSSFVCTITLGDGRDWGAVLCGIVACLLGARAFIVIRRSADRQRTDVLILALVIAAGAWRVLYGFGLFGLS